jgi:deoxyribonuclease V
LELRAKVIVEPLALDTLHFIAGVDVGFREEKAHAAAVLLSFPELQLLEQSEAEIPVRFPYIPGLLSFREAPAILAALEGLGRVPDLIMCDGQGIAHPRRFGIACHIGLLLDIPALGCAKSILVGRHAPVGEEAGSQAPLVVRDEVVGAALRTRSRVKPVYISTGHRIDLVSAVQVALACSRGYRLPEPTRLADRLASRRGPLTL